jgi:hypothetical protein
VANKDDRIHWWIDGLSLPLVLIFYLLLRSVMPGAVAYAISIVLVLSSWYLFRRDKINPKMSLILMLGTGVVTLLLGLLFKV